MDIATYLSSSGRTLHEFAKSAGVSHTYVLRLARRERSNPSPAIMRKLVQASGGLVSYEALCAPPVTVPERHNTRTP